jgi:hypothetical protein
MSFEEVEKLKKLIKVINIRISEAEQLVTNIVTGAVEYPEAKTNVYRIDTRALEEYRAMCNTKLPISKIVKRFDEISRACLLVIIENAGRKNNIKCMNHLGDHYNILLSIKKTLEHIKL